MTILASLLCVLSIQEMRNALRLRADHLTTTAVVTETREDTSSISMSYDLRYTFQAANDNNWYTSRDGTGRQNLWHSFSKEDWETAKELGWIYIAYHPDNPWLNYPLDYERKPLQDNLGNAIMGFLVGVIMLLGTTVNGTIPYFRAQNGALTG